MDNNNPKNILSRRRVAPKKINSIYIDFSCYEMQQVGGNNHNNLPNRNTLEQLAKSAEDTAGMKATEKSGEDGASKKAKERKYRSDFSLRKYVAEKTRKQYEERGELLPLQPNSNEAAASQSPIRNATVTTGVADENQQMEKNTLEDSERALSLSKALDENNVASEVRNDNSSGKKACNVRKQRMRPRKQKTRLLSDIYRTTKPIGETDGVAVLVAHDLLPVAPSGQSPSSQGPVMEEMLPQDPPNDMPTLQRTTTFQVVNVVEDFNLEEEEGCDIRIRRRRKHA